MGKTDVLEKRYDVETGSNADVVDNTDMRNESQRGCRELSAVSSACQARSDCDP